jgi:hypothetical protein
MKDQRVQESARRKTSIFFEKAFLVVKKLPL